MNGLDTNQCDNCGGIIWAESGMMVGVEDQRLIFAIHCGSLSSPVHTKIYGGPDQINFDDLRATCCGCGEDVTGYMTL